MNNVYEAIGRQAYRLHRSADPELSPRGKEQAEALGQFLADAERSAFTGIHPISTLWVSPTRRTLQTMAPLAAASGLRPMVQTDTYEAGGIFEADANCEGSFETPPLLAWDETACADVPSMP